MNIIQAPLRPNSGKRIYLVRVEDVRDELKKIQIAVYARKPDAKDMAMLLVRNRYHWDLNFVKATIVTAEGMLLQPEVVKAEHDAHSIGNAEVTA